jgi:hypothetical protein
VGSTATPAPSIIIRVLFDQAATFRHRVRELVPRGLPRSGIEFVSSFPAACHVPASSSCSSFRAACHVSGIDSCVQFDADADMLRLDSDDPSRINATFTHPAHRSAPLE